jgi:hypothetical protein
MMPARTQQEIVARLQHVRAGGEDLYGFQQEVLLPALDFDHARPLLHQSVTRTKWRQTVDLESQARAYLEFAIDKIIDHRSNSAWRSTVKLAELAWLLGRDDVVAAMHAAGYPCYGAPKVKAFADGLGWRLAETVEDGQPRRALIRMAQGQQCDPAGCQRGCAD